ncbi:MAG: hypothetical protein V5A88_07780, partial [Candidatus Thermoplasmatota archaeon]
KGERWAEVVMGEKVPWLFAWAFMEERYSRFPALLALEEPCSSTPSKAYALHGTSSVNRRNLLDSCRFCGLCWPLPSPSDLLAPRC